MCGSNEESQLGLRGKADVLAPTRVGALESSRVLHVACGGAHTLAVADGGAVLACGSAEFGQLGLGPGGGTAELPRPLASLRGHHVVRVAAGASHSLALSATGGVFACGNGTFGALGRGNNEGEGNGEGEGEGSPANLALARALAPAPCQRLGAAAASG